MGSVIDSQVATVQACYPEIYFACHTVHAEPDSPAGLTVRDGTLLAHIAALDGIEMGALARHLGRAKSTLSPALRKLETLQLIEVEVPAGDARRRRLRITPEGRASISRTSVLETGRVTGVLQSMTAKDRELALQGLAILAAACRKYMEREGEQS